MDNPLNETDKISVGVVKSHVNFRVPHKVEKSKIFIREVIPPV